MNKFLTNSFLLVSFFSVVRLYASLFIASYFFPADYGAIAIPIAFFALIEVFIDGGNSAAIINKNISKSDLKDLLLSRTKFIIIISSIGLSTLVLINFTFLQHKIPYLIIPFILLNSIFKAITFYFESRLIANGRFIFCETISFISTIFAFCITLALIYLIEINGYFFLVINLVLQQLLYGCMLIYNERLMSINLDRDDVKDDISFDAYKHDVLKGSLIDQFRSRIDEVVISFYFVISNIGIYYKTKELAITISGFGSKAISRPWFYVASISSKSRTIFYWTIFSAIFLILLPVSFNFFDYLLNFFIIDFLGENWVSLKDFSGFIYFLAFLYFYYTFNKSTILGLGYSNHVLSIELISLISRIIFYALYLLTFMNEYPISIGIIFYIEIFVWTTTIIIQVLYILYLSLIKRIYKS